MNLRDYEGIILEHKNDDEQKSIEEKTIFKEVIKCL